MRPRSVLLAVLVVLPGLCLLGCLPPWWGTVYQAMSPVTKCMGRECTHAVYIDENFNPTDGAGNVLDPLDVHQGDIVCFFNQSGCDADVSFPAELFGASRTEGTIRNGECFSYTVSSLADDPDYLYHIYSDCGEGAGEGHTTPKVKVGEEDDEPTP